MIEPSSLHVSALWPHLVAFHATMLLPLVVGLPPIVAIMESVYVMTEREIWRQMLRINAEQLFTIGVINSTLQPIVVSKDLNNVPEHGLYSFEPGAFLGRYLPDTFWFEARKTEGEG